MTSGLKRYYGKADLHFITLSCYRRLALLKTVKAMGGEVRIVAEFPDRRPVLLSDVGSSDAVRRPIRRRRRAEK